MHDRVKSVPVQANTLWGARREAAKGETPRRPRSEVNPYLLAAEAAAAHYSRTRHLPPLLALWPAELADTSAEGTRSIIARLEKALRLERRRGRSGHWCYDLNRHAALISALRGERDQLQQLETARPPRTAEVPAGVGIDQTFQV